MALYDYQGNVIAAGGSSESPIAGKRIAMIGDSNLQYGADTIKAYMEETYGCTFIPLGYAGATWETSAGVDATDNSAVGRVNRIVANAASSKLITEYDCIVIMMGTNCNTVGTVADTSEDVSTMCGAVRYCLEKLCYYGRKISLGVILPIRRSDETSNELPDRFKYIKQIAEEFSVPVLDLYSAGRVIPDSMAPDGASYYLTDSVHMGANGYIQFERIIGKWIAYGMWSDGSGSHTNLEVGQNGNGIAVTGATVGQTIKITAVDDNGVPTAWEPVDLPTDEHINSLIDTKLGVIENGAY